MKVEHIAINVKDTESLSEWYCKHLGMKVVKKAGIAHFIADDSGRTIFEIYNNPQAPVPDYAAMDPLVLHIAFCSEDVEADVKRLVAAGATQVGEIVNDSGNTLGMVRDPWGIPLQFARRAEPMF